MAGPVACLAARAVLLALALAQMSSSQEMVIELPLKPQPAGGLFVTELRIGTPPQRVRATIDTASGEMWLPDADAIGAGFSVRNSSSATVGDAKRVTFADGLEVVGKVLHDDVRIGEVKASNMPMILARNITGRLVPPEGVGLLGLVSLQDTKTAEHESTFVDTFFSEHPEVRRSFRLELGGPRPRVLIGATGEEGPRGEGGLRYLANAQFTKWSPLWYVSTRAIALSIGKNEPWVRWNRDFNSQMSMALGAPTLLDSGASAIRLGYDLYTKMATALPASGCQRDSNTGATKCECDPTTIDDDFPTISISFEAAGTVRFLGLDSGDDTIVCIPPSAYVRFDEASKMCLVDLEDGGPRHSMYGSQALVLGAPFFRAVEVLLDLEKRRVGIGRSLGAGVPAGRVADSGSHWERSSADSEGVIGQQPGTEECRCADPKNWWSTGKRFSPKRVVVCLISVSILAAYIYVAHSPSPTAEGIRNTLEQFCGGPSSDAAMPLNGPNANLAFGGSGAGGMAGGGGSQNRRPPSNRPERPPEVEMASRGPGGSGGGGGGGRGEDNIAQE